MDKYMATKPNFVQGHLPVARSVASGENIATFDASSSVWPFRREGKLAVVWSPVDETPVFTLTGGIFRGAPHPNAAKLYLTWFLAKEQQSRLGSFSSRLHVPPPEVSTRSRLTGGGTLIGSSWPTSGGSPICASEGRLTRARRSTRAGYGDNRRGFLFEHDLCRKPLHTPDQVRGMLFRDHALGGWR